MTRHVKLQEKWDQPPIFSTECTIFSRWAFFQRVEENKYIWVKLVIISNFYNEKVLFIVFHVKNKNNLGPYYRLLKRTWNGGYFKVSPPYKDISDNFWGNYEAPSAVSKYQPNRIKMTGQNYLLNYFVVFRC